MTSSDPQDAVKLVLDENYRTYIGDLRSQLYEARERIRLLEMLIERFEGDHAKSIAALSGAHKQSRRERARNAFRRIVTAWVDA
jgi:hypothetical protein